MARYMKTVKLSDLPSMQLPWMTHGVLIVVAISVGVGVYHGVQVNAALHGPMAYIIPVSVALVAASMIFALWHMLLKHGPVMKGWLPLGAIALGAVVSLGAIYTTATFLVSAIVGESAVRDYMTNVLAEYETALNDAYRNFQSETAIMVKLNESATAAQALVQREAGRGGCGPRCKELQEAAQDFERVRRAGRDSQVAGKKLVDAVQKDISEARGQLTEARNSAEQERLFSVIRGRVTSAISELEANSITDMAFNVGVISLDTQGSYAIDQYTQGIRDAVEGVQATRSFVTLPTYITRSPYEAVTTDIGKYGLIWTFAVVLELFPLLLLVAKTLFVYGARPEAYPEPMPPNPGESFESNEHPPGMHDRAVDMDEEARRRWKAESIKTIGRR